MSGAIRFRGYIYLDTIFAILPLVVMLAVIFGTAKAVTDATLEHGASQERLDRIVSNAEYLVNYGLALKRDGMHYPNWLGGEINHAEVAKVGNVSGLSNFGAAFDSAPTDKGNTCIYRLVAYGEEKRPRKIYFCG